MKIHEYQAKEILRKYNVPVPNGSVAFTGEEAVKIFQDIYKSNFRNSGLGSRLPL